MGRTKQLLQLGDKPVIRHCIDALFAAGITDIVVVVGKEESEIIPSLQGLPLFIAINDKPDSDMAESVRAGLRRLGPSSAILAFPSDHPLVLPETIKVIISEHRASPDTIIIPAYDNRRGHPTLFPRLIIDEIFSGITLRDITRKDPARVKIVPVWDKGVILDMDTPEDYIAILKNYQHP
jgi:molybdenum cofactor cytidylyltransferase